MSELRVPEETKNPAGKEVLRLIQNPFNFVKFGKLVSLSTQFAATLNRRIRVPQTPSVFHPARRSPDNPSRQITTNDHADVKI